MKASRSLLYVAEVEEPYFHDEDCYLFFEDLDNCKSDFNCLKLEPHTSNIMSNCTLQSVSNVELALHSLHPLLDLELLEAGKSIERTPSGCNDK